MEKRSGTFFFVFEKISCDNEWCFDGDLFVSGHSIHGSRELIRPLIGVCTQNDILWDDLTVQEHLNFQCRQKGFPTHLISAEVLLIFTAFKIHMGLFEYRFRR